MNFTKPNFPVSVISAAKAHAMASYPNESCGCVVGDVYIPQENIAEDKASSFLIAESVTTNYGGDLQAIIHSHPDGRAVPSEADMRSQMGFGIPFGVVACNEIEVLGDIVWWGDFLLETPLIGRTFVHGVTDCYGLIRGYFWQLKKIYLPDFPRDDSWWNDPTKESLYESNYAAFGFRVVDRSEVLPGDVFLGKTPHALVPNHGGIVLDRGLALHHIGERLSGQESVARWLKYITRFLRYDGGPT